MRIIVLANNIVGLQVCKFLKENKEQIVGLGVHDPDKQKFIDEIISVSGVKRQYIFRAGTMRDPETIKRIKALKPDIIIAAFWGYILKKELLEIPPLGVINFHPGYLPYNRGMNPNVWPIIEHTPPGVTIHYVDDGIDTGDIIAREEVPLALNDTAETIYNKTLITIVDLFKKIWPNIKNGTVDRIKQASLEHPTFHRAKDIFMLDKIDLDQTYTGRELIDILKSRSYKDRFYSYIEENGQRVYIRLQLSKIYSIRQLEIKKYKLFITSTFNRLKTTIDKRTYIPLDRDKKKLGYLALLINGDDHNTSLIKKLAKWREKAAPFFPSQFPITFRGTRKWFIEQLLDKEDRILFLVKNKEGIDIGHIGLFSFDYEEKSCEIDNVVRGENISPGIMSIALQALIEWTKKTLKVKKIYLRVFEDNIHAISFYERNGFHKKEKIPLIRQQNENIIHWVETKNIRKKPDRYFLRMEYKDAE